MGTEPIPQELLLRHAGFLRRLACDLVGDPVAAEDAVQEVWLRALEHPPRHAGNVRGWLRVVLTNLVRTKARSESRRGMQANASALASEAEVAAANASDEATLRFVTEAVLALEEPLRATVLQRYFQGLTTAEIAERDHLPISTVKSRLQRALEILRVRLKSESGSSWQAALLALTMSPKVGKGVILMTLKAKLAIGCVALVAAVFVYRGVTRTPDGPSINLASSAPVASAEAPAESLTTSAPLEDGKTSQKRVAGSAPASASAAPSSPRPQTLFYGSLLDPAGKPLIGLWSAGVSLTDADGRSRGADAKESGAFAFNALPYGKYWVSARADGYHGSTDVIELLPAHAQLQKDFTLQPAPILKIRVDTPEGGSLFDGMHKDGTLKGHPVLVPVATTEPPGKWFNEVFGSLNNPFGIGQFWGYGPRAEKLPKGYMGILMLDRELPAFVSLVNYHRVLQTKEVKPGEDEVHFVVSLDDLLGSMARIQLQVLDAGTQAPIAGAHAMLWGGTYMDGGQGSDASGNIVFEAREPGEFDLHVSAKDHEEYTAHILADSGTTTDLGQILLEKEIAFEAKVVDGTGAPRSERFSMGVLDPATRTLTMERQQSYQSTGDGILQLAHLGRRVYVVRTWNHDAVNDSAKDEPKWVSGNVVIDLRSGTAPGNMVIKLVPATSVTLSVQGELADGLRFRVTDEHALELVDSRFYGNGPRPLSLPQGTYKLALLDGAKTVLKESSMTLGATPVRLELSR